MVKTMIYELNYEKEFMESLALFVKNRGNGGIYTNVWNAERYCRFY